VNLSDIAIDGSGAGGLDTGSEANTTLYYIWVIYDPVGDTVDGMFSLSDTAPTMPGDYSYKRLVGEIYNDSGGNLDDIWRMNDFVRFRSPYQVFNNETLYYATNTRFDLPPNVPDNAQLGYFVCGTTGNTLPNGVILVPENSNVSHGQDSIGSFKNIQAYSTAHRDAADTLNSFYIWCKLSGDGTIWARFNHASIDRDYQDCSIWGYLLPR
jgi:hypothetical protein